MLWFAVWTVLVVGGLAVLFLAGRSAYRKGARLLEELGRAADTAAELSSRTEELQDALEELEDARLRQRAASRTAEDPFGRMAALQDRDRLRLRREERRRRRLERDEMTLARWRSLVRGS